MSAIASFLQSSDSAHDFVVILLGWAGAEDKHLEKYAKFYASQGIDSLRFTAKLKLPDGNLKHTVEVSDLGEKLSGISVDRRLLIHVFSMNGVVTLCSLQLMYPQLKVLERTTVIVCDSAPIRLDSSPLRGVSQVLDHTHHELIDVGGFSALKFRIWKPFALADYWMSAAAVRIFAALGLDVSQFSPYHFLAYHKQLPENVALIYSTKDEICPPDAIAQFSEIVESRGRHVERLLFNDTPHVSHFMKHRKEYEQFLTTLFQRYNDDLPASKL